MFQIQFAAARAKAAACPIRKASVQRAPYRFVFFEGDSLGKRCVGTGRTTFFQSHGGIFVLLFSALAFEDK